MDRVRFGRALGYGARHAAKSLAKAVDAAAAPNPSPAPNPAAAPNLRAAPHPKAAANPRAAAGVTRPEGAETRSVGRSVGQAVGVERRLPERPAGERLAQAQITARNPRARGDRMRAGQFRQHLWSPLANFSSVVSLQVSGTFFALLAAFLSQGLWKMRGAVHLGLASREAGKFYLHAAAFAIFVYFAISSFVRAHLRQRR